MKNRSHSEKVQLILMNVDKGIQNKSERNKSKKPLSFVQNVHAFTVNFKIYLNFINVSLAKYQFVANAF